MDENYSVTDNIGKVGFFKICILPLLIPLKAHKETEPNSENKCSS